MISGLRGCRLLVAGCWLLAAGCWLQVADCWLPDGAAYARQKDTGMEAVTPDAPESKDVTKATPPGTLTSDSTASKAGENVIEMSDIHDIKPPEKIGIDLTPLYYVLLTVLILAILVIAVIYLKKRKKRKKEKKFVSLPPDELAMSLLDELLDIDNVEGKKFYFQLSAILRGYIQGRYGINAPEMTTEEFLPRVDELGIERGLQQRLRDLFHVADPVKFAGAHAVQTRMRNDLNFVISFVKQTSESEMKTSG